MFYSVYLLKSIYSDTFYIGYTSDLRKGTHAHNSGISNATSPYLPYEIVHQEAFRSKQDAKNRETYLKTGYRWRSLNKMLHVNLGEK